MHYIYVRASPELRRRVRVAAVADGITEGRLSRRLIENWAQMDPKPDLDPSPIEEAGGPPDGGAWTRRRYPASDFAFIEIRVAAARADISLSSMVIRVLAHYTPLEVESFARIMSEPADAASAAAASAPRSTPPNPDEPDNQQEAPP